MIEILTGMLADMPDYLHGRALFASPYDTIEFVKATVRQSAGFQQSTLKVMYGDVELAGDNRSLSSYGVPDGSRINVTQPIEES